jgi:hypothetical protein
VLVYLTRCMEKPALLSAAIWHDIVEKLWGGELRKEHGDANTIETWSDCGPHFRARRLLDVLSYDCFITFPFLKQTVAGYGLEAHMKGVCDQVGSVLTHIRKAKSAKTKIADLECLAEVYRQQSQITVDEQKELAVPMRVCIYNPPDKVAFGAKLLKIALNSYPAPIRQCHYWVFFRNDNRRKKQLLGLDKKTITAIDCKAHLLPGRPVAPDLKKFLELEEVHVGAACGSLDLPPAAPEPEADDEDDGGEVGAEEAALMQHTKVFNNWRYSFTLEKNITDLADDKVVKKIRRKVALKHKYLTSRVGVPVGTRSKKVEAQSAASKTRKADKAKNARSFFKEKRTR